MLRSGVAECDGYLDSLVANVTLQRTEYNMTDENASACMRCHSRLGCQLVLRFGWCGMPQLFADLCLDPQGFLCLVMSGSDAEFIRKSIASGTVARVGTSQVQADVDAKKTDSMPSFPENHAEWRSAHSRCFGWARM